LAFIVRAFALCKLSDPYLFNLIAARVIELMDYYQHVFLPDVGHQEEMKSQRERAG
jgi:hypothetical protein